MDSCSLQVAQVLLTLPYSFSQLGMVSGIVLQLFYGFLGSWTAYLISVLYVEYRSRKEKEGVSFQNHVIQVNRLSCHYRPCRPRLSYPVSLLFFILLIVSSPR
jgi:SNF family Na+-dependent transporter